MDLEERRLFGDSLRQAISRHGEDAVDAALAEVDWHSALADDPYAATQVVFGLLGELNLGSSAIDDVLVHALGLTSPGERTVVLPQLAGHRPPATYDRAELTISGLAGPRIHRVPQTVVVIDAGDQAYVAMVATDDLDVSPIGGIDPHGGWNEVTGHLKIGQFTVAPWDSAVVAGQLALAQQLTSAARSMLNLARGHALERSQFDRPIASFQAVRHKLAESLVAVEGATAALDAGWAEPTRFSAAMAKVIAGTAAKTVAKHAQQVLAGMGFTSEHPFHHYLKRTMLLDQLLGSSTTLRKEIGTAVLQSGEIPKLQPL